MKRFTAKRLIALLLAVLMIVGALSGCGGSGGKDDPSENQAYSTDTENKDYSGRTPRLLLSIGGGGNYYEPIAQRMMDLYPGLTVEIEYSNTAEDVLRTQILADNAPDIFNVNSGKLPWYDAIEQGIARPIDEIFELPTMDGSQKLGDLLDMNMFSLGEYEGEHYVMHEFQYLNGFWYDARFFRDNNLTVPTDWDSLCTLAEQCDDLGIDLLGYMGIAADEYGVWYWLWPMIASTDYDLFKSLYNLDAEAWKSDSMKRVVEKMAYIRDNGYYDINTMGCGATEAQIAFIEHDFALYPCGSWLEAEMEGAWTEDWELTYLPYSFGDEEGDEYMVTGGLASMVSADTENWDLVCEFYRLMFSDDESIRNSTAVHHNVMILPDFSEKFGDLVDPSVNTASAVMSEVHLINQACGKWYPTTSTELGNMLNAFMGGDIDGDEFIQRGYDCWTTVANDEGITKYEFKG